MKKLMRRFSKVADSSKYCLLNPRSADDYRKRSGCGVPKGHLPVYVGEEMQRFVVTAEFLNHPIFVKLLNRSVQEYGYRQTGVLRIPCHVSFSSACLRRCVSVASHATSWKSSTRSPMNCIS